MGTITTTAILNKVATLLFDTNNLKWSRTELLTYLNDGQRAITSVIPEATATVQNITLVGGTRQALPTGANMLLEITRNMGTTGTTPGRVVKVADRSVLDETNPSWQTDAASATTALYMYNLRDRYAFNVYPAAIAGNQLEAVISQIPTDLVEPAAITISDLFEPALVDYTLWRAYSKEAPYASANKATAYFQSFSLYLQANTNDSSKAANQMGQLFAPSAQGQGTTVGS